MRRRKRGDEEEEGMGRGIKGIRTFHRSHIIKDLTLERGNSLRIHLYQVGESCDLL